MEFVSKYQNKKKSSISFAGEEKMTKPSFADECDVNKIMAKYLRTGQLPALVAKDPKYGDFADVPTYQEALELVANAHRAFDSLPAAVRAECQNDPAVFLEAVRRPEFVQKHKLALTPSGAIQTQPKGKSDSIQGSGGERPPEAPSAHDVGANVSGKQK